jgi:two-component system, cell cycle response regulator CtrA
MRVLLIEPDRASSEQIQLRLKAEGFNIYATDLGEEGVDLAKADEYDIILLELKLPDITGYEVIRQLRNAKITTPILVLSHLMAIEDKVRAFKIGADEYMTKPFHSQELIARIHAVVRRDRGFSSSIITVGELAINLASKTVEGSGKSVRMTASEYMVLETMALRRGRFVSSQVFYDRLYGGIDEPNGRIISVFVCKVRKKLVQASGGKNFIKTVWGQGFMLGEAA